MHWDLFPRLTWYMYASSLPVKPPTRRQELQCRIHNRPAIAVENAVEFDAVDGSKSGQPPIVITPVNQLVSPGLSTAPVEDAGTTLSA